ncbi:MAG: tetratricopeptide repeat protein [Thermosynechococcaceae cyanobacterium]
MLHRSTLVSLCVLCTVLGSVPPTFSQALIPHTVAPDAKQLQQTGVALLREALQLAQFQQFEPALARTKLATQLLPQSEEAWALLGELYLNTNQLDAGIQSLERSQSLNSNNPGVNFSLGSAYFRKGNYAAAERVLQAGLKAKPGVPAALFDLGNTYLRMGKLDEAIRQYKKAIESDQKFWPAINNIGLVQYEQDNIKSAIQSWKAAITIDEKSSEPKLALAVALYKQGETEQGITLASAALSLDRRYGDVAFLKDNLWGDRLIADTKVILATPKVRATLAQLSDVPAPTKPGSPPAQPSP